MTVERLKWYQPSPEEKVLWESHPSFVLWIPKAIAALVLAIIALIATVYIYFFTDQPMLVTYLSFSVIPLSLAFAGYVMLKYRNTWYVITNRRVIKKTKIVGRDSSSKPHHEIVRNDVNISTFHWLLSKLTSEDIGNIVIRTADDTGKTFQLQQVPEVHLAERYIDELSSDEDYIHQEQGSKNDAVTQQKNPQDGSVDEHRIDDRAKQSQKQPLPEDVSSNTTQSNAASNNVQNSYQSPSQQNTDPSHPNESINDRDHDSSANSIEDELDDFEPSDEA